MHPGTHEWIPTNLIPQVVARASTTRDLFEAASWVWLHTHLRTPTEMLVFNPDYRSTEAPLPGNRKGRSLQGHSGALYRAEADETGRVRYVAQTVGQALRVGGLV